MEEALLAQVLTLLQRQGWATYRTLRRRFHLDTTTLAALTQTLLATQPVHDVDGTRLVWTGPTMLEPRAAPAPEPLAPTRRVEDFPRRAAPSAPPPGHPGLVGREAEVAVLQARWSQAQAGQGQVVVIRGEAGIGKSRLVQAVHAHVVMHAHQFWECRCDPAAQQSALYPLIELFARGCHATSTETSADPLTQLEAFLAPYDVPLADVVPLLASLLAVPLNDRYPWPALQPAQQKQQTFAAIGTVLRAVAAKQPVLWIVEDLHWADPSTLELLALLSAQVARLRCLLLLTHRPEFQLPWPLPASGTVLTVQRLLPVQVTALATQVAGDLALPAAMLGEIVQRTEGVPLFVEEMARLLRTARLEQEAAGAAGATGARPALALPTTVQESVQVRLTTLGPVVQTVAQVAAAWGRAVTEAQLQATVPYPPRQLDQALQRLVATDLLYEVQMPPRLTYVFKHALLQEAAYGTMPEAVCRTTHAQIAQALVARFPEMVTAQPELVAQHHTAAGQPAYAIPYWQRAGECAIARSANIEAISHLTTALALLTTLPDAPERRQQELILLTTLGTPLVLTKGHAAPEVEATYARAQKLCQQLGDTPQLFSTLLGLRRYHLHRGELRTAHELGEELLRLAEGLNDVGLVVRAHHMHAEILVLLGEFARAHAHAKQGIALYDLRQHRTHVFRYGNDSGVGCRVFGAHALWALGYPDQARQWNDEALAWAEALVHPFNMVFALNCAARLHLFLREPYHVHERADTVIALAREQGFAQFLVQASIHRGGALAEQGQALDGLVQIRQGLAAWQATGAYTRPYYLAWLAGAYGQVGQPEEGFRALTEALEAVEAIGEHFIEAELYRLKGELWLARSSENHLAAETCFQQALAVARLQEAKSLELRAAMSLSCLWQHQGKRDAACELLAPIYGWFTEGFDTADLQEARVLLDGLA